MARILVLAGPSGSGKSRLAERSGLPVLRLDDFYRSGTDPALPRVTSGPNAGLVDWDNPRSWLLDDAVAAIEALCRDGRADVPVYDIPSNGPVGHRMLDLDGAPVFVAEGIFAAEVVPACRDRDLLAGAYCLRRSAVLTFVLRLVRDLREHRKPPLVLVRRGLALMRGQRAVVAHAVGRGCHPIGARACTALLATLARRGRPAPRFPVSSP